MQWSEPIGTGKGNITILMIPQNNSCSNDSDVVVAVKSDYQILSQDTQLLNLVVNENSENKSDVKSSSCLLNNTASYYNSKDFNENEELVKKDNNFVAKYFEPEKKLSVQSVNKSIDPVLSKKVGNVNGFKPHNDKKIINIYKFLNVSNLNQVDVFPNPKVYQVKKTESGISASHQDNISKVEPESRLMPNNYTKVKSGDKHNVTFFKEKNYSAVKDAIELLKKINPDALNLQLIQNKGEVETSVNRHGEVKSNGLISKFVEDEMIEKDFKQLDENGHSLAQIEGNEQLGTTCLPFFISFSNEPPTVEPESSSHIFQMLTTPSTFGTGIGETTLSSVISVVNPETINPKESNVNLMNPPLTEYRTLLSNQQETTSGSVLEGNAPIHHKITLEPPVNCETKIINTPNYESEYELTTRAILEGNQAIRNKVTLEAPVICETKIGSYVAEEITIQSVNKVTTGSILEGNAPIPLKITLEPPVTCETVVPKTNNNSMLKMFQENGQHHNGNLTLPLVESSVVIANNNEMSKGKDISIAMNSSRDELPLSDVQDGGERTNGRMCEQFNSNSMSLGNEQEFPLVPSQLSFMGYKKNTGDKNKMKQQSIGTGMLHSKNKILNAKFGGITLIQKENPTYQAENNYTECDLNNEKPVEMMSSKNKTNVSSKVAPSHVKLPQNPKEESEPTIYSILKSSTIFHDEELTIFDKTKKNPVMEKYEKYDTTQPHYYKDWAKETFLVSSSTQYVNESPGKNEFTYNDNISIVQSNGLVTRPECNSILQTYKPSYDNLEIQYFPYTELPGPSNKTPISCGRKKIKCPTKQKANKENIEISGDSVQEIVIKLVRNTQIPETRKKNFKQNQDNNSFLSPK